LQPILLEQACDVTQLVAKSLNATIGSRFANVLVGSVGKIQATQTQSSESSRSQ
jgi:flagellar hook-basal body complex protein FliE